MGEGKRKKRKPNKTTQKANQTPAKSGLSKIWSGVTTTWKIIFKIIAAIAIIAGCILTFSQLYDRCNPPKEKLIIEKAKETKSALIDLYFETPSTINPNILISPTKDSFDVVVTFSNRGDAVAFNLREIVNIIHLFPDTLYKDPAMANAPMGVGKDFFVSPGAIFTIHSHFMLHPSDVQKEISKTKGSDKIYYCIRINYSDSLNLNKHFSRIFELPNGIPRINALELADSKTYTRIEKYLIEKGIW